MLYNKSMKLASPFYVDRKIIIRIQSNSLISILALRFGFVVLFFNEYWIRFRCLAFLSRWRWFNFFGRHTSLPSLSRWVFEPRRPLQFPLVSAEIYGLWWHWLLISELPPLLAVTWSVNLGPWYLQSLQNQVLVSFQASI